jgi:uncharacterized protein YicC (UPF0701 family)
VAKPSLEELLTALKTDHNIDVSQLQAQAGAGHEQAKLSQTIVDALTSAGVVKLSNAEKADGVATDTVVAAVQELATNNVSLSHRIAGMEKREAEHLVDGLIEQGRLMPAQRDVFVEMKLTAPAMFDKAVPATAIVKLSNEQGVNVPKDEAQKYDIDAEITRLSALVK